jgi:hypothetical protein
MGPFYFHRETQVWEDRLFRAVNNANLWPSLDSHTTTLVTSAISDRDSTAAAPRRITRLMHHYPQRGICFMAVDGILALASGADHDEDHMECDGKR